MRAPTKRFRHQTPPETMRVALRLTSEYPRLRRWFHQRPVYGVTVLRDALETFLALHDDEALGRFLSILADTPPGSRLAFTITRPDADELSITPPPNPVAATVPVELDQTAAATTIQMAPATPATPAPTSTSTPPQEPPPKAVRQPSAPTTPQPQTTPQPPLTATAPPADPPPAEQPVEPEPPQTTEATPSTVMSTAGESSAQKAPKPELVAHLAQIAEQALRDQKQRNANALMQTAKMVTNPGASTSTPKE